MTSAILECSLWSNPTEGYEKNYCDLGPEMNLSGICLRQLFKICTRDEGVPRQSIVKQVGIVLRRRWVEASGSQDKVA